MRSPRSLSGKPRFARVFAQGRRARSDGVTVWVLAQDPPAATRLGLVVSARAGGAVERNRTRRRLRALMRGWGPVAGDVVIRADRAAVQLPFQELEGHLGRALVGAGARGTG